LIDSDNETFTEIVQYYIDEVLSEGGFVHPDLIFNCRDNECWLSGVDTDESLVIPISLWINYKNRKASKWWELYEKLGKITKYGKGENWFVGTRLINGFFIPLMDLANHSSDGGKVQQDGDQMILTGSTLCYSIRGDDYLEEKFGFREFT